MVREINASLVAPLHISVVAEKYFISLLIAFLIRDSTTCAIFSVFVHTVFHVGTKNWPFNSHRNLTRSRNPMSSTIRNGLKDSATHFTSNASPIAWFALDAGLAFSCCLVEKKSAMVLDPLVPLKAGYSTFFFNYTKYRKYLMIRCTKFLIYRTFFIMYRTIIRIVWINVLIRRLLLRFKEKIIHLKKNIVLYLDKYLD